MDLPIDKMNPRDRPSTDEPPAMTTVSKKQKRESSFLDTFFGTTEIARILVRCLDRRGRCAMRQTHPSLRNAVDEYCEAVLQRIRTTHHLGHEWDARIGAGRSALERLRGLL